MKTNEAQSTRRPFLEAPLTGAVAGAVIASATWALSGLGQPVWNTIAKEAPPLWLPRVAILLLVLLIFVFSWALYLRRISKEPTHRNLEFFEYGGFYIDPNSGHGICTKCLNSNPRRFVHLMKADGGRVCYSCDTSYRDKKEPNKSAHTIPAIAPR